MSNFELMSYPYLMLQLLVPAESSAKEGGQYYKYIYLFRCQNWFVVYVICQRWFDWQFGASFWLAEKKRAGVKGYRIIARFPWTDLDSVYLFYGSLYSVAIPCLKYSLLYWNVFFYVYRWEKWQTFGEYLVLLLIWIWVKSNA